MTDFVSADFVIRRSRKMPVEVNTVQATTDNLAEIVGWIESNGHAAKLGNGQLTIQTLEGPFTVRPGDVVIQGVAGEFYRCDSEIYERTYEEPSGNGTYPFTSTLGEHIIIGPECFSDAERTVINWQGANYYRRDGD